MCVYQMGRHNDPSAILECHTWMLYLYLYVNRSRSINTYWKTFSYPERQQHAVSCIMASCIPCIPPYPTTLCQPQSLVPHVCIQKPATAPPPVSSITHPFVLSTDHTGWCW
ncbi:hypothetical protein SEVIR_6G013850v4 [Setaria viridis]